jgi:molybdate transport system permease protein
MPTFAAMDWQAFGLSVRLAATVCVILLTFAVPFAYWLAMTRFRGRFVIEALVSLPLVLPATVLGFYLLTLLGSRSPLGQWWMSWSGHGLAFTFEGLVVASLFYSLPFAVQPLATAYSQMDPALRDASAVLGASPLRTFARITMPLSLEGFFSALVLTFAHTIGEFGVVLMVGGNLPGITRTVSIAIYDDVQALRYDEARATAFALLLLSFALLAGVYAIRRRPWAASAVA